MKSKTIVVLIATALLILGAYLVYQHTIKEPETLKIGIIHSQTGNLAELELPLIEAALLAVEHINQHGGIHGQKIIPLVRNGASAPHIFAQEAEKLILQDNVSALFGCATSACRKAVQKILKNHHTIFFYPIQYEGAESPDHTIYTGAAPNQQTLPGIMWCLTYLGNSFYILGSQHIYSQLTHILLKDHITSLGGTIVAEKFLPIDSSDMHEVISDIVKTNPMVIINTLSGTISNNAFYKALRASGITPETLPVLSYLIGEPELETMDKSAVAGNYATWNYSESLSTEPNKHFIQEFRKKYGATKTIGDGMESAYISVMLWAQAMQKSDSTTLFKTLLNESMYAPEGTIAVDATTHHLWKIPRVGIITHEGQLIPLWESEHAVKPEPFPPYRTKEEWKALITHLSD